MKFLSMFLLMITVTNFIAEDGWSRHRPHRRRHGIRNLWKRNRAQFMGFFYTPAWNWIEKETMAASNIFKIVQKESTLPDGSYLRGLYLGEPQFALASWQTKENTDTYSESEDDEIVFDEDYNGPPVGMDTTPLDERDPLYWVVPCRAYATDPLRECIRFHYYLNMASPLYNSWIAAHAYAQIAAKSAAIRTLKDAKVSDDHIAFFVSKIEAFEEVNQWGYLVAMRHWQEMVENWEVLKDKLPVLKSNKEPSFYDFIFDRETPAVAPYLGRPQEHDYNKILWRVAYQNSLHNENVMAAGYRFQQVAIFNQASPTDLYPMWTDKNDPTVENFLKRVRHKFLGKHTHVERLENYLESKLYGEAARKIMNYYKTALAEEVARRGGAKKIEPASGSNPSTNNVPRKIELTKVQKLELEGKTLWESWSTDLRTLNQLKSQLEQARAANDAVKMRGLQRVLDQEVKRMTQNKLQVVTKLKQLAVDLEGEKEPLKARPLRDWAARVEATVL